MTGWDFHSAGRGACAGPSPQGASSVSTPAPSSGPPLLLTSSQQTGRASFICRLCDPVTQKVTSPSAEPSGTSVHIGGRAWCLVAYFLPVAALPGDPPHGDGVSHCPRFTEGETEAQRF